MKPGGAPLPVPWDELAQISAAARALLEEERARGHWDHATGDTPTAREVLGTARPNADWFQIAAQARARPEEDAGPEPTDPTERLAKVRATLGDCRRCGLCAERRSIVFGVGTPEADLVVVGEAPGQQEDEQGEPFVGPAGQMLDKMLENVIGLRRDQVYILNVVKCRPPKNRNPLPDEIEACRPFLDAQLAAIGPKTILVLGAVAYRTLFRTDAGIMKNRGKWHTYGEVPVMPTFHPAYLLRAPQDKRYTFQDLQQLRARYDSLGGRR